MERQEPLREKIEKKKRRKKKEGQRQGKGDAEHIYRKKEGGWKEC